MREQKGDPQIGKLRDRPALTYVSTTQTQHFFFPSTYPADIALHHFPIYFLLISSEAPLRRIKTPRMKLQFISSDSPSRKK